MKNFKNNGLNGKAGLKRIIKAAGYSKDGLQAAWKCEAAFRQVLILNIILFILAWIKDFGVAVRMMLILASFISIIVELLNTAIEAIVDYISLEKHPLAKIAKDTGSAAQMLALLLLMLMWLIALCS